MLPCSTAPDGATAVAARPPPSITPPGRRRFTRGRRRPSPTGQRVFHQKFGYGHVTAVDGNKLEIAFEKAGNKKVVDSFVEAV